MPLDLEVCIRCEDAASEVIGSLFGLRRISLSIITSCLSNFCDSEQPLQSFNEILCKRLHDHFTLAENPSDVQFMSWTQFLCCVPRIAASFSLSFRVVSNWHLEESSTFLLISNRESARGIQLNCR